MVKEEIVKIRKLIEDVDGFLSDREGDLLYNLAKNCKGRGVIVEIGSWKGKSTIWLGKGSENSKRLKIYAIDPHEGSSEHKKRYSKVLTFEEFINNIRNAKVEHIILPIVKTSEEAAKNFNEPVELIFIDGAHEYELVKKDFELWFPKVMEGGIIAFHDTYGRSGPKKVVEEFIYKSKNFRNIRLLDSITYAEKVRQNSVIDRLRNRYVLFLNNSYNFADKLHLPKLIKIIGKKIIELIQ